jgi:hypothetical protein
MNNGNVWGTCGVYLENVINIAIFYEHKTSFYTLVLQNISLQKATSLINYIMPMNNMPLYYTTKET